MTLKAIYHCQPVQGSPALTPVVMQHHKKTQSEAQRHSARGMSDLQVLVIAFGAVSKTGLLRHPRKTKTKAKT